MSKSTRVPLEHSCPAVRRGEGHAVQAARAAAVSLREVMDSARKVPAQHELEDLQRDLDTISAASGSRNQ